ncbi:retron system putative HNH endonuclease [Pseudomonas monteilii]|uniref:TIGR02646 family protein n=1 Tax=Pseudomonas monteilii TaxID=76759 RepID=A0A399MBF3_9PSED|nr:retron system putative HNH endonuclease [Pseudomonas monteilii]RII79142.1 TIGR02646 family protein [Pseudomonas monteilii]
MIKLIRPTKPAILSSNEQTWLDTLMTAIKKYGSYQDIPKDEKTKLISHYRHEQIKSALFPSSFNKCAFCEGKPQESGNIEVEHFFPKSIYPSKTFSWENFLPSCRKCNDSKLAHDTGLEPIVNPYDDNPDEYFRYSDILITPLKDDKKAKKTISVLGLNSARLMQPRAEILINLHTFSSNLEEALSELEIADTTLKKKHKARKIIESLEIMEQLTEQHRSYSGYCKSYLDSCEAYKIARKTVESFVEQQN